MKRKKSSKKPLTKEERAAIVSAMAKAASPDDEARQATIRASAEFDDLSDKELEASLQKTIQVANVCRLIFKVENGDIVPPYRRGGSS